MEFPLLLLVTFVGMSLAAWALVQRSPVIAGLADARPGRFAMLDGLRGILACSVFVHHAYIAKATYSGATWATPKSPLYHFAGDAAVAVFFMITGLLFWDKALAGRLHFRTLMRSRLRRIVPLQMFCLTLVIALCMARGADAPLDIVEAVGGVVRWLGLGLLGEAHIAGVPTLLVDAGVTWSLTIEWLFYLALVPLAGLFVAPRRFLGLVATLLFATWLCRRTGYYMAQGRLLMLLPFLGGMGAAYLVRRVEARPGTWHPTTAPVAIGMVTSVTLVVLVYHRGQAQMLNLLLVPAFIAIVLGNDLFTLLRRRCVRWLGHVSFSLYLLHGLVLVNTLRLIDRVWPISGWGDASYAALVGTLAAGMVGIASLTYLFIERAYFAPRSTLGWVHRLRETVFPQPR